MAGRRNPKAGRGACPVCGEQVFYRRTSTEKLSYECDNCDTAGYAHPGGTGHKKWSGGLVLDGHPGPAPAAVVAPAGLLIGGAQ